MSWYKEPNMPTGYWGEVTATLNWCEEKYRWSKYLAEPCNSLSNIVFVLLAGFGVRWTLRAQLPIAFVWCYLGIALIGIGSFAFHATMKWSMQAADELPMVYTTVIFSWAVFETTPIGQKSRFRILLPTFIFTFLIIYTHLYFSNKENTLLHQLTYAMLQIGSSVRVYSLLSSNPSSALSQKGGSQALVRQHVKSLFWTSTACFVVAFALWNVDNVFCEDLHKIRRRIGLVPGIVLQGHSWWHLLTGFGAYIAGLAGAYLIGAIRESPDAFRLVYADRFKLVPYLVRVQPRPEVKVRNGIVASSKKAQ
ncbi:hypothetical protein V8E36_007910 [Tilletia maclaganii]